MLRLDRRLAFGLVLAASLAAAGSVRAPHAPALTPIAAASLEPAAASAARPHPRRRRARPHGAHRARGKHRPRRPRKHRLRARAVPVAPVDLNRADATTLARVPGIGDWLAARIVAFRELNGAFASLDELADVDGVSERRMPSLARYLVVR